MDLTASAYDQLGWAFGAIQAGTYAGENTTQIWERLRSGAAAAGLETVGLSATDVSQLRGWAGAIAQASDNLGNADPNASLDSSMIAYAPWSMGPDTLALAPEYWARVQMTTQDEQGNITTGWTTMTGINSLDMTAESFNQMVQLNAEAAALAEGGTGTPKGQLLSTGRVELLVAPQR
jgi:hypothetical protein